MKKCEVLSPAGNMEMLKYAVCYGADAVYLGGTKFGARKFANNFNDEELIQAVKYAHLYGVKVYLTLNTLIRESEIDEFLQYATFAHSIGIDAIIVQDIGMISLLREALPNLEIHSSTQMHNNSKESLEMLQKLGIKRVVLDRELSLEEIKKLPKDIEIEVFCHGALCVSYSGQCLFSSIVLNRSGNRGECAGLCRLPYKLNGLDQEPHYYLSLKDLCTADYIPQIIDAGVSSLKIEGRMKSPEYVGYLTKIYREKVDAYYNGVKSPLTPLELENIKLTFNRGLTKGFIMTSSDKEMLNIQSPNHIGIPIGTYTVQKDKIKLDLTHDLEQGDTIRLDNANKGVVVNFLYDRYGKLTNKACKQDSCYIDNFLNITGSGNLRKVSSYSLTKALANLPNRKVLIKGKVKILRNKPIELTVTTDEETVHLTGVIPEEARNACITEESIRKQLTKTGSTVYSIEELIIDLDDNLFVNIKDLNEIRRQALEELDLKRTNTQKQILVKQPQKFIPNITNELTLNVVVSTKEQKEVALKYGTKVYSSDANLRDESVFPKYNEHEPIKSKCFIAPDYASLWNVLKDSIIHTDYMLNVTNSWTVSYLSQFAKSIMLSVELTKQDTLDIIKSTNPECLEILIYGHIELMKMKLSSLDNGSILYNQNKEGFKVRKSSNFTYLMSSKPLNKIDEIREYKKLGIREFRVDLTYESKEESEKILSKIHKIIFEE